jgi:hypothetical protein
MEVFSSAIVATGLNEEMAQKLRHALITQFGRANWRGFSFTITKLDNEAEFSIIAMDRDKPSDPGALVPSITLHDVKFWCDGYLLAVCERDDN